MDANEIVVHREQRHGMRVILDLLAESVGQASKAAGVHPNAKIGALGIACRNVIRIRVSLYRLLSEVRWNEAMAAYIPSRDIITMPARGAFLNPENLYSVLAHEHIHYTGYKDRLNSTPTSCTSLLNSS
jgi:zincin-like metallopeptidase